MLKIVRRVTVWTAAFAVSLSLAGSAKAATLAQIMATLSTSNGDVFSEIYGPARSTFIADNDPSTDVDLQIIESTRGSSSGIISTSGGGNKFLAFTRARTSGAGVGVTPGTNFQVFTGPVTTPLAAQVNGSTGLKRFDTSNGADFNISPAFLNFNSVGTSGFRLVLQNGATLSGPPADGTGTRNLISTGSGQVYNSTDSEFRAFAITSGADAGSYLIAFESGSGVGPGSFTFAGFLSGAVNPEPTSMGMIATGLVGLIGYGVRRRRMTAAAMAV